MAVLHLATLTPSKLELLSSWVPKQPWWPHGDAVAIEFGADYRFDDPAGEVGIQTYLVRTELGSLLQVPVTYRDAPLDGADEHLIGTSMHSVLGKRWVYDGCADPVCVSAFMTAMFTGGSQAVLEILTPEGKQIREPRATVWGTGSDDVGVGLLEALNYDNGNLKATVQSGNLRLEMVRSVLARGAALAGDVYLQGTWEGQEEPVTLASASR